ncbi:MAG: phosphopyruvate hydratase [Oscillospiraceae bacterium]
MKNLKIKRISAREILDSRANPTIEAIVMLECGVIARASVPSGKSKGIYEALELRDEDVTRYNGQGVLTAVQKINTIINSSLKGINAANTAQIDDILIKLDATWNKSNLGANTTLAVSIACARAAAKAYNQPLYRFIGGTSANVMPIPMMNIINGGVHSDNGLDVQEYMIMPRCAVSFAEGLRQCVEVYHTLGEILDKNKLYTAVGDEGGYSPNLTEDTQALDLISEAIIKAGYKPYDDFSIALDAAASGWKADNGYKLPKSGKQYTTDELISYWQELCRLYPICSLEDPLDEEDWTGWQKITKLMGDKIQLVGDDLFVTHLSRLKKGINIGCANSILIKPNQVGTISETLQTIRLAKKSAYNAIISHRSGETEDTFIADFAVAINAGQIKAGAPCRSERTAKYNQLLRIETAIL